eukprot:403334887
MGRCGDQRKNCLGIFDTHYQEVMSDRNITPLNDSYNNFCKKVFKLILNFKKVRSLDILHSRISKALERAWDDAEIKDRIVWEFSTRTTKNIGESMGRCGDQRQNCLGIFDTHYQEVMSDRNITPLNDSYNNFCKKVFKLILNFKKVRSLDILHSRISKALERAWDDAEIKDRIVWEFSTRTTKKL